MFLSTGFLGVGGSNEINGRKGKYIERFQYEDSVLVDRFFFKKKTKSIKV